MNASTRPRVIVVIPARYASQRLPGKPLAEIAGRPMIAHVIERARRARTVDEVLVATDDRRIADAVEAAGCQAVMTPAELQSGTDRIAAAVRGRADAGIIVNVQGDEPLIPPSMIDQAVQPLLDDSSLPASTLVRIITDQADLTNPSVPKVVLDKDGFCLYFSRSTIPHLRGVPPEQWLGRGPFYRHIGLYVFRREFLIAFAGMSPSPLERAEKLEQLRILEHGYRLRASVTDLESFAVDTPEDLERARVLAAMATDSGHRA